MKKKFIFLTMLLLTLVGGVKFNVLNAQETITIGDKTDYSTMSLPFTDYYKYYVSQQIYTSDEIKVEGVITHIAYHIAQTNGSVRNVLIYMTDTDKQNYESNKDWISVEAEDLVYTGEFNTTGTAGSWLNIELNKQFQHAEGKNIAVTIYDYTGSNINSNYCKFYASELTEKYRALAYSSSYSIDLNELSSKSGTYQFYVNQASRYLLSNIKFTFKGQQDDLEPEIPTNLTATAIDYCSIALTWEAAANAQRYNVYNGENIVKTVSETSCTIDGLDSETTYTYTVTAVNVSKESEHSNEASATTLVMPKLCNIVFTLKDTWGDGWNGNKLIVKYGSTTEELTLLEGNEGTYTLGIPEGSVVNMEYKGPNYPAENSFEVKYESSGELIWSKTATYGDPLHNGGTHTFTIPVFKPIIEASVSEIALGTVRMGNYWTEKPVSETFNVVAKNTTVTGVTCDNTFFEVDYESGVVTVSYDNTVDVSGEQTGTITIAAEGASATVAVSSTAYKPAPGDVWELAKVISLENGYTEKVTGMYDDYILPGETVDGNLNDAVYKFTLANDGVVTANVNGTNAIVAIYDEDFGEKEGPSSDNNNTGVQSGPSAPTTFFYDFNDKDLSDFTLIDADGDGYNWHTGDNTYIGSISLLSDTKISMNNRIVTKNKYSITNSSTLQFKLNSYYQEILGIEVSENGTAFEKVSENIYGAMYSGTEDINISLRKWAGKEVFIAIYHKKVNTSSGYKVAIDNLTLTDGSAKSRTRGAQIENQYPAGTYYLVAAAEGNFTLNLSTSALSAPREFAYTAPEDGSFVQQTNPKLSWESAQFATSYDVYLGTTANALSKVAEDITATSYQTKDLANNTKYYWQIVAKNSSGNTEGETWSFVTPLDVPQNVTASSNEIYPDNNFVTISWNKIEAAKGYNVYIKRNGQSEGIAHNYNTLITKTSYQIENMDYSQNGHIVYVTAVYEFDGEKYESEISKTETIKVTGYGKISGTITDGKNVIAGATVVATGTDEFGKTAIYTTTTNEDGKYSFDNVLVGKYTLTASKDGYIVNTISPVEVEYNSETTITNIELLSTIAKIDNITAAISDDKVSVSWNADYNTYNVYRKKVGTETAGKLIATVTDKNYIDADWAKLSGGIYQYGVDVLLKETSTQAHYCGFESGLNGWSANGGNTTSYSSIKDNSFYFGDYYSSTTNTMTSPTIALTEYSNATLKFYLKNDSRNTFAIKASTDGKNWNDITLTHTEQFINDFELIESSLSDYAGQSVQLQITCSTERNSYTYIDEIEITTTQKYLSQIVWSNELTKPNTFNNAADDNDWSNVANWDGGVLPTENDNVIIAAEAHINETVNVKNLTLNGGKLRLYEGALLTVSEALTDKNYTESLYGGSIFVYDGAQIIQNNETLKATFTMNINNPSEEDMANWANPEVVMSKTGWQFIASPVKKVGFTVIATEGGMYDLYKYNGTSELEWDNYKDNSFGQSEFELGVGYLASHATKETISMLGTFNSAKEHTYVGLTYNDTKDLANFHLLGNPFTFDMDMRKAEYTNLIAGVAIVNENGGYTYVGAGNEQTTIPVGDGFFVKAIGPNPSLSYDHNNEVEPDNEVEPAARGSEKANSINVIATGKAGQDNVVINFAGQSEGFNKLQNFNDEIATVFVANNGRRYGIANVDENVAEVELSFVASQMGNYSISLDVNGEFETVTLVDRFTGIETNMLLEDEYNFTATSNDSQNRFVVRLTNGQQTTDNSQFVYQSGEELILSIEGTVQIIDMLGRVVYSNEHSNGSNRINVSEFNNAAYVVRVVNEEGVKSQKVVIY